MAFQRYPRSPVRRSRALRSARDPAGLALPGVEVRVVDANDRDLPCGEAGELLFRSETFMVGYWNQPELTAQTLRDGWLHSGDIGIVDERGEIHIRDRIKDIIVSSGNNVYPKEVENAIIEITRSRAWP